MAAGQGGQEWQQWGEKEQAQEQELKLNHEQNKNNKKGSSRGMIGRSIPQMGANISCSIDPDTLAPSLSLPALFDPGSFVC